MRAFAPIPQLPRVYSIEPPEARHSARLPHSEVSRMNNVAPRPTQVRELIQPLGLTVCQTQGLGLAAERLSETGVDHVVITTMSEQPLGLLTERDIEKFKQLHPAKWSSKRCACAVKERPRVHVNDSLDRVIEILGDDEIRPLLVYDGHALLGVIRPTEVFQWSAEHRPRAFDRLAAQARRQEQQTSG